MNSHSTIEPLEARIAPATFHVLNTNDTGSGSLREAMGKANDLVNHPGLDTIVFDPGAFGTIKLLTGEIAVSDALIIAGPGGNKVIIDGNSASRIFNIDDGHSDTDSPVSISGL